MWDVRNMSGPVDESVIDTGNNVLTPLFDLDASVVYLVGKAETLVRCCEVCAMPKFGLDLMKCELDRLILLTRSSIYPLPYIVPRRAYYDFHADVFPDTYDTQRPGVAKHDWLNGINGEPVKVALNPESQKRYLTNLSSEVPSSTTSTTNNKMTIDVAPKETTPPETKTSVASLISSMNKTNSETPVVTTIKVTNTSKPTTTSTTATIPVQSPSSLVINVDNSYTNKENIVVVEVDKKDNMDLDESPMPPPTATPVLPKPTVVLRNANNQNQVNFRTKSISDYNKKMN